MATNERLGPSVQQAMVQLRGECPDCIETSDKTTT
jgi:hypothetical protein